MNINFRATRVIAPAIVGALALSACTPQQFLDAAQDWSSTSSTSTATTTASTSTNTNTGTNTSSAISATDVLAANSKAGKWTAIDESNVTDIDLSAAQGTVTISEAGTYRLSGTFTGQVVVDAPEDANVGLILDNATITNDAAQAILVSSAKNVAIKLVGTNKVADATSYAEDASGTAAIFSATDLAIFGEGSLEVQGRGADGIATKDDLYIESGTITVTAADDGIRGKDSLTIAGGTVTVTAGNSALKSNQDSDETKGYVVVSGGTVKLKATKDGIHAATDAVLTGGTVLIDAGDDGIHADATALVEGASVDVTSSVEGLEGAQVVINSGTVNLASSDDGINGSVDSGQALVLITGGKVVVNAAGDGIDSNGSITQTGGDVVVYGPTDNGNGALDYDASYTFSGGTLWALGSTGMAMAPSNVTAGSFVMSNVTAAAGDNVKVTDSSGKVFAEVTAAKNAQNVVFASADLSKGTEYTITAGSNTATATAGTATGGMGGPMGSGPMGSGPMGGGPMGGGPMGGGPMGGGPMGGGRR